MKKDNLAWRLAFATRLNESMEKAHLNQTELAQRTSIGKSDINNYTKGKYLPKQDRVFLMAQVLGVDPVWLYALDVKYKMEARQEVATKEEAMEYLFGETKPPVTETWDPEEVMRRDEDGSFRTMFRGMSHMKPEDRKRLVDAAKMLFAKEFSDE